MGVGPGGAGGSAAGNAGRAGSSGESGSGAAGVAGEGTAGHGVGGAGSGGASMSGGVSGASGSAGAGAAGATGVGGTGGASGVSGATGGGGAPPTTCAQVNNGIGCCSGSTTYFCDANGAVASHDCSQTGGCGWISAKGYYGCNGTGQDPSGVVPIRCGGAGSGGASGAGGDGPAERVPCTNHFGSAVTESFGRIDGYLVSIVMPGAHGCNDDDSHLHLQVSVGGAVYDVAVTLVSDQSPSEPDVYLDEIDAEVPGGAWAEGWHPGGSLDYVKNFGVHDAAFTPYQAGPLATKLAVDLATVNHISVFATGYGPTGIHDVHRNPPGHDGALVLEPLSSKPHVLLFHFATQSF